MEWSDLDSWEAQWEIGSKDPDGNVGHGNVLLLDSRASSGTNSVRRWRLPTLQT